MAISIADSSCSSPRSSLGFLLDPEKLDPPRPKQSMWHRLGLRRWLGRDDRDFSSSRSPASSDTSTASNDRSKRTNSPPPKSHDNLTRRLSRRVGVGLPRSTTFKRQQSEHRDQLAPINTEPRRAVSADRRTLSLQRTKSPQSVVDPRLSAPEVNWREDPDPDQTKVDEPPETNEEITQDNDVRSEWDHYPEITDTPAEYPVDFIEMELEKRWILNLSMHFRDRSEREKFFVTYAEAPNRWRRVTISCDYRDAEPDSLEQDLKELRYQRDKCARVYESIRESLLDIQFYDTVTNLKLETRDGRLHVHVTEDVNEIIPYPPISSIGHLPDARLVPERRLHFEAHLSGFVYNVRLDGRSFIKKEIPGPDTVDEFLYEINALHALQGTPNVIQVEGIVVDDRQEVVKGLLISFAEKGAMVDILYENRGLLAWERRERWARQIVHGLCEIHEAGYVQGDFTLSNIVVDANDDAKIIDINRRGCPVGWEPPEIADKIESNQRISMYIGVKTDLFQLGMTLWALAMEEDEPERQRRPFVLDEDLPIPEYYRRIVSFCLSPIPRNRLSAKELLNFFPLEIDHAPRMSTGVGLHNGALPLYDSRAAFMYPRGRQMGGFGHSNNHVPQQLPHDDSFGSISSPETIDSDGVFFDREEQVRHMEMNDTVPTQVNGIQKGDSMIFDERRSVDDVIPVRVEAPTHPEDGRALNTSEPLHYEDEINVDGRDHRYRNSFTEPVDETPIDIQAQADEFSVPGLWEPVQDQSLELSDTQAPVNEYPVDSAIKVWPVSEPSRSVTSLQQSSLPINPAAEPSMQEIYTRDDMSNPDVDPEYRHETNYRQGFYLSESNLPINPAIKSPEDPLPPLDVQSAPVYLLDDIQDSTLNLHESKLPINPAADLPETDVPTDEPAHSQAEDLSPLPAETTLSYSPRVTQDQSANLIDSQLPINPATKSSQDDTIKSEPNAVAALDTQPSTISPGIQDEDQAAALIDSQLPINPASQYPEEIPPVETASPITQPAVSLQESVHADEQNSLLIDSSLPINPAVRLLDEALDHQTNYFRATPILEPTIDQDDIQNQDRTSILSNSHLPINPAVRH
ncbi:Putative Protein kinase domain-containing protein [Aspergillus calidoustus]|uniref:Protein kinase domain-containing protein n=1 Tax=Aspergillus calidoustus TaxID=454130 RepID=A0A0U5FN02_ASPCI|nr:Putative Protein kinase domain-containing protein [Aspergillus calidoustus]